ncbi:MAG TPA: amidohydrolase family protein [Acidimicrobiales bacterium]|nr:amidohydrolase family protein [Acidimicrobiales bacterium]
MARLIIKNANLLDGEQAAVPGSTVVVDGDRITDVRPGGGDVAATGDDRTVDLGGRTLMPGMTIGHFHGAYVEVGSSNAPFGLENPPAYSAIVSVRNLETALACGFTNAVGAGSPCFIDPSLARAVDEGMINGPFMVPCSRELSTTGHSNDWAPWQWEVQAVGVARLCDGAEGYRLAVREEIKHGARMVKLYLTGGHGVLAPKEQIEMTRDELQAAVDTAHSRGARIRAHIANKEAILMAIDAGIDIIDHADGMDAECIEAILASDTYVVPGIYFPELVLANMEKAGQDNPGMRADLVESYTALREAMSAGVKLCLGDDYGAVGCYHGDYAGEMVAYVKNVGLTPLEVLKMATVNGAGIAGRGDDAGKIEAGRVADLVVVDGDPSTDIGVLGDRSRIEAVLRSGEVKVGALPA